MTNGYPHIPTPEFHSDAKGLDAHAAQNHRNALRLNEDLGHGSHSIWAAVRWPVRRVLRMVRRS